MKNTRLDYTSSGLVILNGLICLVYREKMLELLPLICGVILLIKGSIQFCEGIVNKDYASLEKTNMEKSFNLIAIGIGVLIKRSDALFVVGMFWGLHGLIKASNYFNRAFYNFYNKDKWILILIKGIIEFSLSFVLIFDPFGKVGHHIVILGLELVFDGTMELISNIDKINKANREYTVKYD